VSAVMAATAGAEPPIVVELDPAIPVLETDRERLRTVLVNLLANARQAVLARPESEAGPVGSSVMLTTGRLGHRRVAITIRDRGIGIRSEDLPKIFDPFFTTRRAGTGLGLPIAKNIIDGLGGTLAVTSAPGAGTNIRIEIGDAIQPALATRP
jgi:signal transduction histidine kinase